MLKMLRECGVGWGGVGWWGALVLDILARAVDVVRSRNDEIEAEHVLGGFKVEFAGIL